ncbi:hypothetical protein CTL2C_225 [Chlamydia trachomatis L2c]|nr:hypothetical protein CTL2C_225 [Chlamydia trachomatis L2c]
MQSNFSFFTTSSPSQKTFFQSFFVKPTSKGLRKTPQII